MASGEDSLNTTGLNSSAILHISLTYSSLYMNPGTAWPSLFMEDMVRKRREEERTTPGGTIHLPAYGRENKDGSSASMFYDLKTLMVGHKVDAD